MSPNTNPEMNDLTSFSVPSAPDEDALSDLPPPLAAPKFYIEEWDQDQEPAGITRLRGGESFFDGVKRISERLHDEHKVVAKTCDSILPGMRVADDQVGVIFKNGAVQLRPAGAYVTTLLNPWKMSGAVVPIKRTAGVEFDPIYEASLKNARVANLQLGNSYRQIVLQAHQVAIMEDQGMTRLVTKGTYVYSPDTEMRGVVDLNRMMPIMVKRETEDTAAAITGKANETRVNQHGREVPKHQAHGTTIQTTTRYIPSGYTQSVAGITFARPEKGFVVMHKDCDNRISMTESICVAQGNEDFVRRAKDVQASGLRASVTLEDLEIEFGDLNHYAKSTPLLELKSKDNLDALCRAQIKWHQTRPDIWVAQRGAFTDPFDMLEEKCANMMRDWLLSVPYADALEEKAKGFTKVEHQWSSELNDTGRKYGVCVLSIEITALRFPSIDQQDEQMALQLADTNLAVETSRQSALREQETSKFNQAMHIRQQEDRDREAEACERQEAVERRKNCAAAETVTKKAEMDTKVVEAEMALALAQENKQKKVTLAKASAEAEATRVKAEGQRDAAHLAAEGEIAATQQRNKAQLDFLTKQAALLKENPGLVDLLRIQNDLLKTEALAKAAEANPNVVLLTGQEGLEARRMNKGHAPQVPGAAILSG